jgi:hypothetical protein
MAINKIGLQELQDYYLGVADAETARAVEDQLADPNSRLSGFLRYLRSDWSVDDDEVEEEAKAAREMILLGEEGTSVDLDHVLTGESSTPTQGSTPAAEVDEPAAVAPSRTTGAAPVASWRRVRSGWRLAGLATAVVAALMLLTSVMFFAWGARPIVDDLTLIPEVSYDRSAAGSRPTLWLSIRTPRAGWAVVIRVTPDGWEPPAGDAPVLAHSPVGQNQREVPFIIRDTRTVFVVIVTETPALETIRATLPGAGAGLDEIQPWKSQLTEALRRAGHRWVAIGTVVAVPVPEAKKEDDRNAGYPARL